jgi:DNA polymerase-3 subunit beta
MKVICTQENLKNGLLIAGRIISPNNTLPILNNILIKTENGLLTIASTNLEVAVSTKIRCKVEKDGGITVFSKTIMDLISNLPNKNIILETKDGELYLETENYHTTIKTLPVEEFPLIPEVEGKEKIIIPAQDLKIAVNEVVFAVSTNQTQPEISGLYMGVKKDHITFTATDRYRLAEKTLTLKTDTGFSHSIIIPQKTVLELSRIVAGQTGDVEVLINSNQVSFTLGETQIISRLIDGQYPDYKQIIPDNFITTIHTQKLSFINALKAGGIFSQGNNSVKFTYSQEKQQLTVTSESQDLGRSVVDIPSEISGGSGELTLNHRYILDCLSSIETPNVIIKIINDNSPSVILPEGKNDYIYLVMPIKS